MPINASPHFERAQIEYEQAQTTPQKIMCLKKMIALAPKHKGSENLLKQLRTRLAKLKYTKEKESRQGKHKGQGIKKHDMQAVIIGKTNSGKSSLLSLLTNAQLQISEKQFQTNKPEIGMMPYASVQIQLIENPAIDFNNYDKGLTYSADTILIVVTSLQEIIEIKKQLMPQNSAIRGNQKAKLIIAFNKIDLLNKEEKRKLTATLKSKKYNFVIISIKTKQGIEELKEKIFQSFDKIRVYTKEPGKEKSNKPIVMEPESTVKNVAEKILHGFSKQVKETKIWGPSSKFSGQKVGLKHELKDLDVVEFRTQ